MAAQPGQLQTIPKISTEAGVPPKFLEQILLSLRNAGLLHSRRGAGGGYLLERPPGAISLWEIVDAMEAEESSGGGPKAIAEKPMERFLEALQAEIQQKLKSITLEDVLREYGSSDATFFEI